jgi:hypothetical protein
MLAGSTIVDRWRALKHCRPHALAREVAASRLKHDVVENFVTFSGGAMEMRGTGLLHPKPSPSRNTLETGRPLAYLC